MERVVQRRAQQVVHRRVDDGEVACVGMLEVLNRGQQHAGVADQRTAGFQHQMQVPVAARVQPFEDAVKQGLG
ncbi:hypothetical protein D3C71_1967150 [compost metagenome]